MSPRVLMVTTDYEPGAVSGIGVHATELTRSLVASGLSVKVLTARRHRLGSVTAPDVLYADFLGVEPRGRNTASWLAFKELQRNVALAGALGVEEGCNLVHFHDYRVAPAAIAIARRHGLPTIMTKHSIYRGAIAARNGEPTQDDAWEYARYLEDWSIEAADHVLGVSQAVLDSVSENSDLALAGKSSVASPGTMFAGADLNCKKNTSGEVKRILFAGRLEFGKRPDVPIRIVSELTIAGLNFNLKIAGQGSARTELDALATDLGVRNRVQFLGQVAREEMPTLYEESDIVIVPSSWDAFPTVVMEAQAFGCVVLGSNVDGLREQIQHGVTGYLCDTRNLREFVRIARDIAEDRLLQKAISEQSAAFARKNHAWHVAAGRVREIYEKVLQRG